LHLPCDSSIATQHSGKERKYGGKKEKEKKKAREEKGPFLFFYSFIF
jgi:hypothetical protein